MSYTIEKITALIGARRVGSATAPDIAWLLTDSRSLAFPESTLFFALRTPTGDGHRYLPDLYRRGVRAFVVGELPEHWQELMPDACLLLVVSPLRALQRLAERHREEYRVPVVGVTGSNGKTLVKEWIYQLLRPLRCVTRSPRSYNSQVGVPLSVWLMNERTEVGLFEAGISRPGEMAALRAILQPTIGVMTCIGPAHSENFASLREKCLEKLSLFRDADTLIYCQDDPVVRECIALSGCHARLLGWSRQRQDAPVYVACSPAEPGTTHLSVRLLPGPQPVELDVPFADEASLRACIHTLCAGHALGLTAAELQERLPQLEGVAMRLEVTQGVRGLTLVHDYYNSDLASLSIALDVARRRPEAQGRGFTLVLSDIPQSGRPHRELYAEALRMAQARGVQRIIGVGPDISAALSPLATSTPAVPLAPDGTPPPLDTSTPPVRLALSPTTEALLHSPLLSSLSSSLVLLKGARSFHFEQIADALTEKVHETVLEVNLSALAANLAHYRAMLRPGVRMVCMVKASAYGAGSVEVARTLQDRGVDYLAVAVADEGVALRQAGITTGIIVMNPEPAAMDRMLEYALEPEVYCFSMLERLVRAARHRGMTGLPVHIKLDTGMHRLGFHPDRDMPRLLTELREQQALLPRSVFSHFVGSDSPEFDEFSQRQFELFQQGADALQAAYSHHILRHICNTAGQQRFPSRQLDMVRLGLGLYGVDPIENKMLQPVCTLRSTILQLRHVPESDTVGYSRRGRLQHDAVIAAVPIGYADGLNRHLGCGRGHCLVGGKPAPYVGNICMDVCMIDVTGIPCHEGDAVEIFGAALPPTELAQWLDTIPYEVLTSVSERVRRVYVNEA